MRKTIISLLVLIVVLGGYAADLVQKNAEELFLSKKDARSLENFQKNFGNDQALLLLLDANTDKAKLQTFFESHHCIYIDLDNFKPNQALVQLPNLEDQQKLELITSLEEQFSNLHIVGMPYTNAHLAGMSIKIQKVIFPIVFFAVIFLTFIVFKNLKTTFWLFLNAFVGVPITLGLTKFIYGYSTILTTISPLVTFILSYGLFLHLAYGVNVYTDRKKFYKTKLTPILVMMVTTIAGFLGLLNSELVSIKQFALITSLALTCTWTITFLLFHFIELNLSTPPELATLKQTKQLFSKYIAMIVLVLSCTGGFYALQVIPKMTEAIYFFPKTHPIQKALNILSERKEGTPQIDLVISKINEEELSYSDFQQIIEIEQTIPYKIISINQMVSAANQIYSGNAQLPEHSISYFSLKSRVPPELVESYLTPYSYRISILAPPSKDETKQLLINEIESLIAKSSLKNSYHIEFSGLSFLVHKSQSHLIKSLLSSFASSFIIIILVFAIYARNLKAISIFFIINLASVCGGMLIMHLTGMTLNVSSIMTVSVTIGLVVDSTVHIMHASHSPDANNDLTKVVYPAIIVNHIIFVVGFLLLTFQDFLPIRDFASGLIILMLYGLFLDLFILPVIEK